MYEALFQQTLDEWISRPSAARPFEMKCYNFGLLQFNLIRFRRHTIVPPWHGATKHSIHLPDKTMHVNMLRHQAMSGAIHC
jgi:hypothetical protein